MARKSQKVDSILKRARGGRRIVEELDNKELPDGTAKRPLDGGASGPMASGDVANTGGDVKKLPATSAKRPLDEDDVEIEKPFEEEVEDEHFDDNFEEDIDFDFEDDIEEEDEEEDKIEEDDEEDAEKLFEEDDEEEKKLEEEDEEDSEKKELDEEDDEEEKKLEEEDEEDSEKSKLEEEDEEDSEKKELDEEDDEEEKKLEEEDEEELKKVEEEEDEKESDKELKEGFSKILKGEKLSRNFKGKLATMFEGTVKSKVAVHKKKLVEKAKARLKEQRAAYRKQLSKKVDSYLDYIVEEWVKENRLALDRSIRAELAESFIGDLRQLFVKYNVEIPESQYNLVEELQKSVEDLEKAVSTEMESNLSLKKQLKEALVKNEVLSLCEGMTVSEKEKFLKLTEGMNFKSKSDIQKKLKELRESNFSRVKTGKKTTPSVITESFDDENVGIEDGSDSTDVMKQYVSIARRYN